MHEEKYVEAWLPFIYQYAVGGLFFFFAIGLSLRKKAVNPSSKHEKRLLLVLVLGFIYYFAMHGVWILLATP